MGIVTVSESGRSARHPHRGHRWLPAHARRGPRTVSVS